jgi:hypothetical protein
MGFLKSITKPFKKIAKRIKKTASNVWKGIQSGVLKPLGKLYGKTFGKLGPLGMVAASLILPGIGSMMAAGWTSLAGTLGQAGAGGFLNAVSAGMNAVSTGLANAGSFMGGISDKIGQTLTKIGGSISDGASNLFQGAGDWAKTKGVDVSKMGDWVAKKAQSFGIGGQPAATSESLLNANPELRFAANANARNQFAAIPDAAKSRALLGPEATNLSFDATQQSQINQQFAQTKGLASKTLLQTGGEPLASPNILAKDLNIATQGRASGTGTSFAEKALKSAGSLLQPKPITIPEIPDLSTTDFGSFGSNRLGIGGTGATGGQFLSQQQQAFFQKHAQLLGQAG